jgi:hypothetical protein
MLENVMSMWRRVRLERKMMQLLRKLRKGLEKT